VAAGHPFRRSGRGGPTWTYYAIALLGAAMTPDEVFFFSSGGVEEHWGPKNPVTARLNVFVGFPLGGLLSLSIMARAAVLLGPAGIEVDQLSQVRSPSRGAPASSVSPRSARGSSPRPSAPRGRRR